MSPDLYDPFDPAVLANPYPSYQALRASAPVYETPAGFWAVSRHEDVQHVLKNPQLFSSAAMNFSATAVRGEGREEPSGPMLVASDPPVHTRLRGLVSRAFTTRRVTELEPRIRELVTGLLRPVLAKGRFELVHELSAPLPTMVIAEMLGIDPERRADFKRWSDDLIAMAGGALAEGDQERAKRSMPELADYLASVIAERRRAPRADLISALLQASEDGQALTPGDVRGFATLLLIAGNETTTNLLSNAILALLANAELLAAVQADPTLIPNLIEETLRWDSPVQGVFRSAAQDVPLAGTTIPQGHALLVLLGSANRDERRFPDPDRFDLKRDTAGHLSFGYGIHFCIGAPLARLEARLVLEQLLPAVHGLVQDGESERLKSFFLRGLVKLPLRFA